MACLRLERSAACLRVFPGLTGTGLFGSLAFRFWLFCLRRNGRPGFLDGYTSGRRILHGQLLLVCRGDAALRRVEPSGRSWACWFFLWPCFQFFRSFRPGWKLASPGDPQQGRFSLRRSVGGPGVGAGPTFSRAFPGTCWVMPFGRKGWSRLRPVTAVYGLSFLAVATSALLAWVIAESASKGRVDCPCGLGRASGGGQRLALSSAARNRGRMWRCWFSPIFHWEDPSQQNWVPWLNPDPLNALVERSVCRVASPGGRMGRNRRCLIWPEDRRPSISIATPSFRGRWKRWRGGRPLYIMAGTITFAGEGDFPAQEFRRGPCRLTAACCFNMIKFI